MAFRFSLRVLLRLQKSVERQQELLLQLANAQVAQVTRQIEQVERWAQAYGNLQAQELQAGLDAAELHFEERCQEVLEDYRKSLAAELLKVKRACAERRAAFEEARRQREVTDSLRERQLQAHRTEERRREQRQVDDLFLLRRSSLRPD